MFVLHGAPIVPGSLSSRPDAHWPPAFLPGLLKRDSLLPFVVLPAPSRPRRSEAGSDL